MLVVLLLLQGLLCLLLLLPFRIQLFLLVLLPFLVVGFLLLFPLTLNLNFVIKLLLPIAGCLAAPFVLGFLFSVPLLSLLILQFFTGFEVNLADREPGVFAFRKNKKRPRLRTETTAFFLP